MPWYKDGTHDRVFNTLLRDSIPLTDQSIYLKEHLKDKESIFYYSLENIDKIPAIVDEIFENSESTKSIIEKGKSIVLENYTWQQIVAEILKAVEA